MSTEPTGQRVPNGATSFYDFSNSDAGQPVPESSSFSSGDKENAVASASSGGSSSMSEGSENAVMAPYSQFEGSNLDDVRSYIVDNMQDIKPETPEEREKRERRERRVGFLARVADTLGAFHRAYSYGRGVKPMDLPSMSDKARARFDRAKALRDRDKDRYMNYLISLGRLSDADRNYSLRVSQANQKQANWLKNYETGRKDREEDNAYRNARDAKADEQFQQKFEEDKRKFGETKKMQAANLAEQRRHNIVGEGLAKKRVERSQDGKYTEWYTGSGMIRVPNSRVNAHNISYVFSRTPANGRPSGKAIIDPVTKNPSGRYAPASTEQMMSWIGENLDDANVQRALREIGGVRTDKGRGY